MTPRTSEDDAVLSRISSDLSRDCPFNFGPSVMIGVTVMVINMDVSILLSFVVGIYRRKGF